MSPELKAPEGFKKSQFKPGQSGCPGGKRKEVSRAEKALAKLLPGAVAKLEALLESDEAHLRVEGLKLLFKYTLTTADKRAGSKVDVNVKGATLRPEIAARLAALEH
jgi:hypothetical protein